MERFHLNLSYRKRAAVVWQVCALAFLLACNGGGGEQSSAKLSFQITSISPSQGPESGGTKITLKGANLRYAQTVTVDGIPCGDAVIDDVITCETPAHIAGTVSVRVWSQNEGEATGAFTYLYPSLRVNSFTPTVTSVTGGALLTLTGSGFNSGVSVSIGDALCDDVALISPYALRCTVPALSEGEYEVSVKDADESDVANMKLVVSEPPSYSSISPAFGSTLGGTVVTITGSNFKNPTVAIGGTLCAVTARTPTSITCTTSARAAGLVNLRIQNSDGNGVTVEEVFRYILNPKPLAVSPTYSVPDGGATIKITGSNFKNGATVDIAGDACSPVTYISSSELQCITPAKAAGFHNVTVTNPDTISGTLVNGYESRYLPPTISSINPGSGFLVGGTTVTVRGTRFRSGATVTIDGKDCLSLTVVDSGTITCVTPAGESQGKKDVVVSNEDKQSATLSQAYGYVDAPKIISVSPIGGPLIGGTKILITGTGLDEDAEVTVGGDACNSIVYNAPLEIECEVPAHAAGAVDIEIKNLDGQVGVGKEIYKYANAPTIDTVSPAGGRAAGGATITITGTGFVEGTTFIIGENPCLSVTYISDTVMECRTPAHEVGTVDLYAINPDTQVGFKTDAYTYQLPPTVTAVTPPGGAVSGNTVITITGTNFIDGATVLLGTTPCPVSTVTPTSVTCTTPANPAGKVNVRVTNPDTQAASLTNGYTYVEAPVVKSVSPASGALAGGTVITVSGNYFVAGATVSVGGVDCSPVTVTDASTLKCTTGAHAAGSVTVTVTVDSQSGAAANAYTYAPAPEITSFTPAAGALAGGTEVTITGDNFVTDATVSFGNSNCVVSALTATSITCTTTASSAGAVTIKVTNPDNQFGQSSTQYIYQAAPVVTEISPAAVPTAGGTVMTMTGTNFDTNPTVTFDGVDCPVSASTSTSITCTSPAHAAGEVTVVIKNSDNQSGSLESKLIYLAAPTVATVTPSAGALAGGTTLTITGTGFYTGAIVDIGGADCAVVTLSATSITCTTSTNMAGEYDVVVTNVDSQPGTLTDGYTYQPAPDIDSVAFNAGPTAGGRTVTITGTGFVTGATVKFDTSDCEVISVAPTSIQCTTPAHAAGTVNVTVINTDGQTDTATNAYTYQAAPTVSTISPAVGPIAGGTSVTITGTGILAGASVFIGSVNCTVTAQTATTITCTTGGHAAGVVDVQVTNADGQSGEKENAFTYLEKPEISSIAANAGKLSGGDDVTITGEKFYAGASVSIGGSACTVISLTDTTIVCRTSAHAAGTVDVIVTNIDGQTETLASAFTYRAAPSVSSVTPTYGAIGGGTPIQISGSGFVAGATVTVGSSDCTVTNTTATQIECTTTLSLISGAVSVTVTNPDDLQTGTKTLAFIYLNPPTVTGVSPGAGSLDGGTTITITGTGFYPGATVAIDGSACTNVTYVSDTALTCKTPAHVAGLVSVTVTNPDTQSGTRNNAYTYQGPPAIMMISPASGPLGGSTSLTITGTGFVSGATVKVGDNSCTNVVVTPPTTITCLTPPGLPGAVGVTVTNADGQAITENNIFTYQGAPIISSVTPSGGPLTGGTSVTISGTNLRAGATVTIGTASCAVDSVSLVSITCTTSAASAGTYTLTVKDLDGQTGSLTNAFTYQGAPTVAGISPAIGSSEGGTSVTITGTNFLTGATVNIGGSACNSVNVTSTTTLTCTTTTHAAGTGTVTVTNTDGQAGNGSSYLYRDPPAIASVSPTVGALNGGTEITLTGTGFLAGATVTIGGTSCSSVNVVNGTTMTCTTAAKTAGTYDVTVTNTDSLTGSLSGAYTYQGAPTVSTVAPNLSAVSGGQVITVSGTGFLSGALVSIGGTSCAVSSVTSTSIICTTGAKLAGTYDVVVTNSDGQSGTRSAGLTYVNAPVVSSVTPATGSTAGGTLVTITGSNFYAGSTVDFGGSACTSVNVMSNTTLTCVTPAGDAGPVTVSVISPVNSTGSQNNAYTYTAAPAEIAFVTGGSNPSNPDSYGNVSTNVTHTYTVINNGDDTTSNLSVSITGADANAWQKGTDTCSGLPLDPGETCTLQVTFLGGGLIPSGSYSAVLNISAATGGTITNTMSGTIP